MIDAVLHPQVTFVIPHYNHSRVIARQLRAIAAQQGASVEVIIVDDASSKNERDALAAVAAEFDFIKIIWNDQNEGPIKAALRGLDQSSAPYVCLVAADDEVGPHLVEKSLMALRKSPSAAFCFSERCIAAAGQDPKVYPLFLKPGYHDPQALIGAMRASYFVILSGSCMYRRDALVESNALNDDLGHFADTFANLVLAFRCGAVFIDEALGTMFMSDSSYSTKMRRSAVLQMEILDKMLSLLERDNFKDLWPAFRRAGVLPEHSLRALVWLILNKRGRLYLSSRLILTCLVYSVWSLVRRVVPFRSRVFVRKYSAASLGKS